jgi:hypothetical protein
MNFVEETRDFCVFHQKGYSLEENEEIQFYNFFDISRSSSYTLSIKNDKIFIWLKSCEFGSMFYGNCAIEGIT